MLTSSTYIARNKSGTAPLFYSQFSSVNPHASFCSILASLSSHNLFLSKWRSAFLARWRQDGGRSCSLNKQHQSFLLTSWPTEKNIEIFLSMSQALALRPVEKLGYNNKLNMEGPGPMPLSLIPMRRETRMKWYQWNMMHISSTRCTHLKLQPLRSRSLLQE